MNITVIGTGYVGLITGLCLSTLSHTVTCVDSNKNVVQNINSGKPHIYEKDLDSLLLKQLNSKAFSCIHEPDLDLRGVDLVLICVGTPSDSSGNINLAYLESAIRSLSAASSSITHDITIVIKSSVIPGTVENLVKPMFKQLLAPDSFSHLSFAMNPEFLREGSAISDFMNPDRIVLGCDSIDSEEKLQAMYSTFTCSKIVVNTTTAEFIKYFNNTLLALQISAVNELSRICESFAGVDASLVMDGVLLDHRWRHSSGDPIGIHSYLKPGCGFGGSCFPKDVKALSSLASSLKLDNDILRSITRVNESQPLHTLQRIKRFLSLSTTTTLFLGLSFKPDTDDMRDSPSIPILEGLIHLSKKILVNDPLCLPQLHQHYPHISNAKNVELVEDWRSTLDMVDNIIICTAWSDYTDLKLLATTHHTIYDCRGLLDISSNLPFRYFSPGLGT